MLGQPLSLEDEADVYEATYAERESDVRHAFLMGCMVMLTKAIQERENLRNYATEIDNYLEGHADVCADCAAKRAAGKLSFVELLFGTEDSLNG